MSQVDKSKKTKSTSERKISPPLTRQRSKHNYNLKLVSPSKERSQKSRLSQSDSSSSSSFLYQQSQLQTQEPRLRLSTPEETSMQRGSTQPSRSDENLLEESISCEESPMDISDSLGKVNLSGVLNKTLEGTSEMLKLLEDEETTTTNQTTINQTDESFFEDKYKKLKSSLIVLAKASHHRTFMETCLNAKTPPKNMRLWVEPHIYHSSKEVEREWRETLTTASLKLLASLIKHYTKIIDEEKQTLEGTLKDVTTKIKHTKNKEERDTQATKWKELRQTAQDEAKKIGDDLKETRHKKLTQRKRKRERSQEDLIPQPKRSFVEALTGFMQEYATKKQTPKNGDGPPSGAGNSSSRGKGPANGRSYVKKTALPQPRH